MIRIVSSFILVVFLVSSASAQRIGFPAQTYGGSGFDAFVTTIATADGGSIAVGVTASNDGFVSGFAKGQRDLFLVKFTKLHTVQWRTVLGGDADDFASSITQLPDESYIIAGFTQSTTGDIHDKQSSDSDAWILKVEPGGTIVWSRTIGGTGRDQAAMATYIKGHIYVGGSTTSNDAEFRLAGDSGHAWLAMLDDSGRVQWLKRYGGSGYDVFTCAAQLSGDSILLGGYSNSNNGDVSNNHGGEDFWSVIVNDTGKLLASNSFGGPGDDEAYSVTRSKDGGAVFIGRYDRGFDNYDVYVVKLHSDLSIDWSKTLGGSSYDEGRDIIPVTDDGFLVAGFTNSNDGNVTDLHGDASGGFDAWLVRLDSLGSVEWQKTYGGVEDDFAYGIVKETDTSAVVVGLTQSVDGDFLAQYGDYDALYYEVVFNKFAQPLLVDGEPSADFAFYQTNSSLVLRYTLEESAEISIDLLDIMGRERARLEPAIEGSGDHTRTIDLQSLTSGTYFVRLTKDGKSSIRSIQITR